jgi:Fungal specific transcription factor domain
MCFELGWHQFETLQLQSISHAEKYRISCLFWSIYVLDRRWSFGTGLPFVIQEDDMDPLILKPVRTLTTVS